MKNRNLKSALVLVVFSLLAPMSQANLIAYWPLDDEEGLVAKDVVGGYDGAITSGTWVTTSKVGASALEAFGDDEVICVPEAISTTADLTLTWWMIDNQASYGTIMDKSFTDSLAGFDILVRPSNEDSPLRFRIGGWQAYGGWGGECRLPSGAYNEGEWVHIACVYDSATDTASIYVNGELPENGALNPKTGIAGVGGYCEGVNNTTAPLYLRGGKETFSGVLDDVAMWDRALTPEEVMTVFTSGPLSVEVGVAELAVTSLLYTKADGNVELTWNSREGETYVVKYSTDLENWENDLDDGVIADAGESTTRSFNVSELEVSGALYFRIEKQ
jgi:hypothetical protein